jgi:hypothetical protein
MGFAWRNRRPATMADPGGVPERPKGTGCKPVGSAYGGSNPPAPTPAKDSIVLAAFALKARASG